MSTILAFLTLLGLSYSSLIFSEGKYYFNDSDIDDYNGLVLVGSSNVQIYCQPEGGCTNAATEIVYLNSAIWSGLYCSNNITGYAGCAGVSLYISGGNTVQVSQNMQNLTFRSANLNNDYQGTYRISSLEPYDLQGSIILSSNDNFDLTCVGDYSCQGIASIEDMLAASVTDNEFELACVGYQSCSGTYTQSNFDSFDVLCINDDSCSDMELRCSDDSNNNPCALSCLTADACDNVTVYAEDGINSGVTLSGGSNIANLEGVNVYCGSSYTTLCTLNTSGGCTQGTVTC